MEITFQLEKQRRRKGRVTPPAATEPAPRIPRISRLMALAIRFEGLIRDGAVPDRKTIAQLGGVTRARLTQIMQLLNLAPDIQEELLFLQPSSRIVERTMRPIVRSIHFDEQRRLFAEANSQVDRSRIIR